MDKKYLKSFSDFGKPQPNELGEDYDMDLDADDFPGEHAKLVLSQAFDESKNNPGNSVDLDAAFNKVIFDLDLGHDDNIPDMIKDSVIELAKDLVSQANHISLKKQTGGSKPPTV